MAKSISVKRKTRGRPATGVDPLVGVRLPPDITDAIDKVIADFPDLKSRSGAIRKLLSDALTAGGYLDPQP